MPPGHVIMKPRLGHSAVAVGGKAKASGFLGFFDLISHQLLSCEVTGFCCSFKAMASAGIHKPMRDSLDFSKVNYDGILQFVLMAHYRYSIIAKQPKYQLHCIFYPRRYRQASNTRRTRSLQLT